MASWPNGTFAYAVSALDGSILREGKAGLSELAASIAKSNIVLLIAATDVTLLELTIPPMTESRLKQALPNLIEDQIMSDSSECVLMLGTKGSGSQRTVAVAQRSWLQQLSASLFALGAGNIKAVPAQLCLPWKKEQNSARLEHASLDNGVTLRLGEESGVGMMLEPAFGANEALTTIAMLARPGAIDLQLPAALVNDYKLAVRANPEWDTRFTVQEAKWPGAVQAARSVGFNLMAGLNNAQTNRIQWKIWRWPLVLATLVLVLNILALNYDYWTLKREATALRQSMIQIFKTTFPKETVVAYPMEQMRKNLEVAQRGSGQASPDDFTLLLTQFGSAWNAVGAAVGMDKLPELGSVEYKDRALVLQVKGTLPQKELQLELDARGLVLKKNNAEIWQIRTAK